MNLLNLPQFDKRTVKQSFNRAARDYNRAAILQTEVLNRLLERLQYIRYCPKVIVDIGCGTGQALKGLRKYYPKARIISMDLAFSMLRETRSQYGLWHKKILVNADMERLPFANNSFDLIFSNLALQWANDLPATFAGMRRVARNGGLLMFATFGPMTLLELRNSWSDVDQYPHVHQFVDMHDVGDALMAAGYAQPVIDSETIRLEYDEFRQVLNDLKAIGASNADRNRSRGLMTAAKLAQLAQAYRNHGYKNGKYIASYELVYGHAWVPDANTVKAQVV